LYQPNGENLYSSDFDSLNFDSILYSNSPFITNLYGGYALNGNEILLFSKSEIELHETTLDIVVSINLDNYFNNLRNGQQVLFFTLFQNDSLNRYPQIPGNYFAHSPNREVFNSLSTFFINNEDDNSLANEISANQRSYIAINVLEYFSKETNNVATSFVLFDTTMYKQAHTNSLTKILVLNFLILITLLVAFRIFKARIMSFMLNLNHMQETKNRERTKESIYQSDQLMQVFNTTANGIRIIDINHNIIKYNESFCKLSGIPFLETINEKCYNLFPSTFCHTDNCPLERIKNGESIIETKEIRFSRNGEKVTCQYRAKPLLGENGELLGIIEDFKDITELELEEEKHRQTRKQYEALLASMPVGVFIRDFEGNMFYQNSYMDKAFGPFTYEKKNIKYVFPSNQVNRFFEEDKFVERYGSIIVEEQLIDNNNVERTYVTHKFKFSGAENKSLIGGVAIDISKRKNAEHNFYVLSKAINNTPIGVLVTSPEGIVEFCNPEFERISGKTSENLLGSTIPELFDNSSKKLDSAIQLALTGAVHQEEMHLRIFMNRPSWFAFSVSPVFNRHGNVAHLIFVFDDITQRKEYEKEITIAKTKAEESERLKTAFLSNLSHEIRTPLNAILGFSSILNSPNIPEDEKYEIPSQLVNHSNSLLELINDLIDISAIETYQFEVKKRECQLNKIITETFNDVIKGNTNKSLKTSIKLGVVEENFTILSDPDRLSQLIRHLLSNAIKFTSNGFVEMGYTFKDASTLMFYLIDTGVGLSKEEQSIIFNPFRQADDSRTRSYNGMGLGLAISKHIVERLGGRIWVNSTKNQGSTFYFTMPYIPVRAKFDEFVEPLKENQIFNWKSKTILVADDIDSNYQFLKTIIKPTGADVIWAKNGREAVETVKEKAIDLVLMDIVMPELDGFEATKQIKSYNNQIKVICQTAYPSPENHSAGIASGMDRFLSKPIATSNMMRLIDEYIHQN
jgi:PAS domain S-box-containing protein